MARVFIQRRCKQKPTITTSSMTAAPARAVSTMQPPPHPPTSPELVRALETVPSRSAGELVEGGGEEGGMAVTAGRTVMLSTLTGKLAEERKALAVDVSLSCCERTAVPAVATLAAAVATAKHVAKPRTREERGRILRFTDLSHGAKAKRAAAPAKKHKKRKTAFSTHDDVFEEDDEVEDDESDEDDARGEGEDAPFRPSRNAFATDASGSEDSDEASSADGDETLRATYGLRPLRGYLRVMQWLEAPQRTPSAVAAAR